MPPVLLIAFDWTGLLMNAVMPLAGIALISVFVLSFILPFGNKIEASKQLIKGFGLDIQVSVRTLLLLGGFALVFTSVFFQLQQKAVAGLEGQIKDLNVRLEAAKEQVDRARRHVLRPILRVPGSVNLAALDLRELECRYILSAKPDQWIQAPVMEGLGSSNSVMIVLADISGDDVIPLLELRKKGAREPLAVYQNIYPLQPVYELKKPDLGQP